MIAKGRSCGLLALAWAARREGMATAVAAAAAVERRVAALGRLARSGQRAGSVWPPRGQGKAVRYLFALRL